MTLAEKVQAALAKAIEDAGSRTKLGRKTGVDISLINRFACGERKVKNMTVGTLERLFPEMKITFFRDEEETKQQ